jgi:hypothetical protein
MKNSTKIVTFGIIPLIVLALLIYDVYAIAKGGSEASISNLIIVWSYKMPFMVYMLGLINGILVGHLFWRMKSNKDTQEIDHKG